MFFALALITIDLAAGLHAKVVETGGDEFYLKTMWSVVYWSIQVLAWLVIPLCQQYPYTGEFSFFRKLLASIWANLLFYIVIGAVGVVVGVALAISVLVYNGKNPDEAISVNIQEVILIAKSISNAFGLTMLICFLGYGMVEFPRYLWNQSNMERKLAFFQFQGAKLYDQLQDEYDILLTKLDVVRRLDSKISHEDDLRKYVDIMMETAKEEMIIAKQKGDVRSSSNGEPLPDDIRRAYLVKIHKELIDAIRAHQKAEYQWEHLQKQAFWCEDVINSRNNPTKAISSPFRKTRRVVPASVEFYYYKYARKHLYRLLTVAFIPFVLILCYSEFVPLLSKHVATDKNLSVLGLFIRTMDNNRFLLQVVGLGLLSTIATMLYYGMFNMDLISMYQVIPHHSDAASLLYSTVFLCRCVPALCFNFLQMLGIKSDDQVAFYSVMGIMQLDGLAAVGKIGVWFSDYFPILLVVVAVLTLFNIVDRLAATCGRERFTFKSLDDQSIQEGKILLQKSRRRRVLEMRSNGEDTELDTSSDIVLQVQPDVDSYNLSDDDVDSDGGNSLPANMNSKLSKSTADRLKSVYEKHNKKKREREKNKSSK
ncbi:LMBR1 domain-containing protein [Acrasis kona]|uniref:LMBR1 domain-containing protein n=1 Tax=Acrasis kona TaxID=1008807 RepID=A0AAW2Z595_9EUKA